MTDSKKFKVLWLKKPHAYSRKAELYCHERCNRAKGRDCRLFWMNCHLLYDEIRVTGARADVHNTHRREDFA